VERKYRVNWGELLLGRNKGRVSIEYSVDILLRLRFCCIVTVGPINHRMRAVKNKGQRGLLDENKVKCEKFL